MPFSSLHNFPRKTVALEGECLSLERHDQLNEDSSLLLRIQYLLAMRSLIPLYLEYKTHKRVYHV